MSFMSGGRGAAGIAVLTALTLGLSACGGGSDDQAGNESAAPVTGLASDCQLLPGPAIAIPVAVTKYKFDGKSESLEFATNDLDILLKDPAAKELNAKLHANNVAFTTAKDNAARNEILPKQKALYEEFMATCGPTFDAEQKKTYQSYLDTFPTAIPTPDGDFAPTTSSAPPAKIDLTPVGTTVKVGQSVYTEFTDRHGKTGPIKFTVTKVERGKAEDLKLIDKSDDLKDIVYIRAKAENAEKLTVQNAATRPSIEDLSPDYSVETNDGSSPGFLMGLGDFTPCMNSEPDDSKPDAAIELCTPLPMGTTGTEITEITLQRLYYSQDKKPLYTWTN